MTNRILTALPADVELPVPVDRCFDAQYGLEVTSDAVASGSVTGRVRVRDELNMDAEGDIAAAWLWTGSLLSPAIGQTTRR
jgi:hypothetical protein